MAKAKTTRAKKPMDQNLVNATVARLQAALGNEPDFDDLLSELATNPAYKQPELAAICKLFYGDASSKTSKVEALRRIRSRHISLLDFRAKSRAQHGKSAA